MRKRARVPFDVKLIVIVSLLLVATVVAEYASPFGDQYVEANVIDVEGNTIILGRDCTAIVADTTADQARSIRLGIEKRIEVRPTTHDAFVEALNAFDIVVEEAAMTRFEDEIYYGELVLRREDTVLRLDVRPTDALGVALRTEAPFKINKQVLQQRGENIC